MTALNRSNTLRVRKRRSWPANLFWYTIMIAFALVTALPFLWTALMSLRPNSANIFRPNQPPQIIPIPGMIGWGEGLRIAQAEGIYTGPNGFWRNYEPNIAPLLSEEFRRFTFPATTANYYRVWTDVDLPRYFSNSFLVAFCVVVLQLITSSLAAYPLSKMRFKGRDAIFYLILATIIFPDQLTLIPTFIISVQILGLADTLQGLSLIHI